MNIPLSKPDIGEREIECVTRALRSGQLSLGPRLTEFEQKFAAYVGARYAVAASSGTSALHLCIAALGIGAGDEVLTSSFSFVASTNCLLYERAVPSFVDIDSSTLNIDPVQIREAVERDYVRENGWLIHPVSGRVLRAILPVHVFGLPCDMDAILGIARMYNLRVIEDACEALGATYRGQHAGTFGDAGVFGFYPNKQLTSAEGGMVVTNDPRIAESCRILRNQGREDGVAWLRHVRLGHNYRLSELHCALGLAQLERIDELLAARDRVARLYSCELADISQIALPCELPDRTRSWFVYAIRLLGLSAYSLRDYVIRELRCRGIACQTYFPAIHRQPYFQTIELSSRRPLPRTESASDSCLVLPFFPSMTETQVAEVAAAVRQILANAETAGLRDERKEQVQSMYAD